MGGQSGSDPCIYWVLCKFHIMAANARKMQRNDDNFKKNARKQNFHLSKPQYYAIKLGTQQNKGSQRVLVVF